MLAFTISFTELYWYTGTVEGMKMFCLNKNNSTEGLCPIPNGIKPNTCEAPIFTSVLETLVDLFWALFGQLDIQCLQENRGENIYYIDDTGTFLMGLFHISIIFILLNMLIAMMTESFDETNQNKDAEWKFYRTDIWIRFIRQDFGDPPPMNLLPNFYKLYEKIKNKKILKWRRQRLPISIPFGNAVKEHYKNKEKKHLRLSSELVKRFKVKFLK